ncbi:MAG: hypothetical protein QOC92_2240, partial [Acidimicrobiaceae bacterium]
TASTKFERRSRFGGRRGCHLTTDDDLRWTLNSRSEQARYVPFLLASLRHRGLRDSLGIARPRTVPEHTPEHRSAVSPNAGSKRYMA